MSQKRIGIFSGTFDPIHVGHIETCLVARAACELDEVRILVEKKPHRKSRVTPAHHRIKMIKRATHDFQSITLQPTEETNITFTGTGAQLARDNPGVVFVMIIGSDLLEYATDWDGFGDWIWDNELCVVLRDNADKNVVESQLQKLAAEIRGLSYHVLPAVWSPISSQQIRQNPHQYAEALHRDVLAYILENSLYQKA